MAFYALGAWISSVLAGVYLQVRWFTGGGLFKQPTKVTRYPVLLVVGHPLAAMAGLAVWVLYLATRHVGYAWAAFGALLVTVLQGFMLFTRWLVGRRGRHARGGEQPFPAAAITAHIALGLATVGLVFLTAIEIGRR